MIHTKIAETKAAVAFLVLVAVNQMQDENASTIDMVLNTLRGSREGQHKFARYSRYINNK